MKNFVGRLESADATLLVFIFATAMTNLNVVDGCDLLRSRDAFPECSCGWAAAVIGDCCCDSVA